MCVCVLKLYTYIYIYSSGTLSVLNTWLSAPEGFEKGHCRGILSASQEPNKTRHIYGVSSIHRNGGIRKLQNKLRTNPTRRPHSHPWYHHPASSAPSETGAGKRSTFTSANIFCQKRSFTCIYSVFPAFLCLLFFLCLQIRWRNQKKCLSHVISRILHSVGSLFLRLQCVGILLGRSFC